MVQEHDIIAPQDKAGSTAADKIKLIMQLRNSGVRDNRVLSAIEQVPREMFVSDSFRGHAYDDMALPIERGQTISQPTVVAWMTWALELSDRHRVLEIGTGSGYQAAVLSKLCRMVYSIERHRPLYEVAKQRFAALDYPNITCRCGDGMRGWPEAAPFDRVIVTAAAPEIPKSLTDQLADGGVLVAPVGSAENGQMLLRVDKVDGELHTRHLMPVKFVPLLEGVDD